MSVLKVDYKSMKDAELVSACRDAGMLPPLNEEGRVIRAEAIRMLKDKEAADVNTKDRVWVVFHNSNNPSAGPYVFASINDKNFQAPYEKKVCIPKYFLSECIDRALTTQYREVKQQDGSPAYIPVYIPTYPYTLLGPAEPETEESAE